MKLGRPISIIGCIGLLAAAGCGSSAQRDVSQTVARNAVAVGMKKEFSDHSHSLKGLPTCRTTAVKGSTTKVNIACAATTDKGERATLIGRTNGANEVRGTFTGFVNNAKVFTDTCIGC
jgi:cytochrome c556